MISQTYFDSEDELEEFLTRPTSEVIEFINRLDGDIMILGVGGKMGPTLAILARRAIDAANLDKRVIGVSRFADTSLSRKLNQAGIETIASDLLDEDSLQRLPQVANVIYMVAMKFGTTGQEARTWAINTFLPGMVARTFKNVRFVILSSGNVYPFVPVSTGGCTEKCAPSPIGEYGQSVLGRERVFEFFAGLQATPCTYCRLNYAVEMRYGVLLDIARKVWMNQPIDMEMGHFNAIWMGDANAYILGALTIATHPGLILNITGPETISVQAVAIRLGELMGKNPIFLGQESELALLSNAQLAYRLLGYPKVSLAAVVEWVAQWVMAGKPVYDKPTKYQVRDGRF